MLLANKALAWQQLAFAKKIKHGADPRCGGDLDGRERLRGGRGSLGKYFAAKDVLHLHSLALAADRHKRQHHILHGGGHGITQNGFEFVLMAGELQVIK